VLCTVRTMLCCNSCNASSKNRRSRYCLLCESLLLLTLIETIDAYEKRAIDVIESMKRGREEVFIRTHHSVETSMFVRVLRLQKRRRGIRAHERVPLF